MSLKDTYNKITEEENNKILEKEELDNYFSNCIRYDMNSHTNKIIDFDTKIKKLFQEAVGLVKEDKWMELDLDYKGSKLYSKKRDIYIKRKNEAYQTSIVAREFYYKESGKYVQLVYPDHTTRLYKALVGSSDYIDNSSLIQQLFKKVKVRENYIEKIRKELDAIKKIKADKQKYVILEYKYVMGDDDVSYNGKMILFEDGNVYNSESYTIPKSFYDNPEKFIAGMIKGLNE